MKNPDKKLEAVSKENVPQMYSDNKGGAYGSPGTGYASIMRNGDVQKCAALTRNL